MDSSKFLTDPVEVTTYNLGSNAEFRFETGDTSIELKLISGTAEIFGTELVPDNSYKFYPNTKMAVFTYYGCDLEVSGKCDVAYTSEDPLIVPTYSNCHISIEGLRREASISTENDPPITLIIGPPDSGKSTLSRILVNLAAREGQKTVFIDLDPDDNQIGVPGTLSASVVERPFEANSISLTGHCPLLYFYGYLTPSEKRDLYKYSVEEIAKVVNKKITSTGAIINTPSWGESFPVASLIDIVNFFDVNSIIVIGSDRLYNEVKKELQQIPIVKKIERKKIQRIFLWVSSPLLSSNITRIDNNLFPSSKVLPFGRTAILRFGAIETSSSLLPIGSKPLYDAKSVTKVTPSNELSNTILGVSFTERPDNIILNIAGIVYISNIDLKKNTFKILVPNKDLPTIGTTNAPKPLLFGTIKWIDAH